MNAQPSAPTPTDANADDREIETRELELELIRIRAEAKLIRLEARAAEIELRLRRSARGSEPIARETFSSDFSIEQLETTSFPSSDAVPQNPSPTQKTSEPSARNELEVGGASIVSGGRITSWEQLLAAVGEEQIPCPAESCPAESPQLTNETASKAKLDSKAERTNPVREPEPTVADSNSKALEKLPGKPAKRDPIKKVHPAAGSIASPGANQFEAVQDDENTSQDSKRSRPAAWIVSVLAHAAVLLVLAGITLSVREPMDQLAISGSVAEPTEETIETMVLEQTEQPESTESESSEQPLTTVNPMGDTSMVDVSGPAAQAPIARPGDSLSKLLSQAGASAMSTSNVSTTFFGADGGGNHFVYLLDSSKSMDNVSRDGFDVARNEVLRAVDSLKAEQRFYVVFFGKETLRMTLSDSTEPEPRSVYATDTNKLALKRWAMSLTMQDGRWPKDALTFAFELRPDCIFLLTDGAMPEYVPDFVAENNIVPTLLDGPKPKSIIHTIGFHDQVGEPILRKIASQNAGTYNFVPAQ